MSLSTRTLATHDTLTQQMVGDPQGLHFRFLPGGHLHSVRSGDHFLVNLTFGCPLAGSLHRLIVELTVANQRRVVTLIGPGSTAAFAANSTHARWQQTEAGVGLTATLALASADRRWDLTVALTNSTGAAVGWRAFHGLDVGLSHPGGARNNEAYTSQYIDHRALSHPRFGTVLATRQNMAVDGRHPVLFQACVQGCDAFATDALDVFGAALSRPSLPLCLTEPAVALPGVRQVESSYIALLSRPLTAAADTSCECRFTAILINDHPTPTSAADLSWVENLPAPAAAHLGQTFAAPAASLFREPAIIHGADLGETDLRALIPGNWELVERSKDGALWSFFTGGDRRHVVTRAKEAASARPHANILRSGGGDYPDASQLTTTTYMAGVFNGLLSSGHCSFHRLLSFPREYCGLMSSIGQRVWIRSGDAWKLLGVPSCFEMSLMQTRWIYRLSDRTVTVTVSVDAVASLARTRVAVTAGAPAEFLITHGLIGGSGEYDEPATLEIDAANASAKVSANPEGLYRKADPTAHFVLKATDAAAVQRLGGAELVPGGAPQHAMLIVHTWAVAAVTLEIFGHTALPVAPAAQRTWQEDARALSLTSAQPEIQRLNHILPWFIHNGMIHLTVPHGLEQYNGGAWGTRDVTQGSIELLLSLGRFSACRDILLLTYRHQFKDAHHWPQWFMTDPFGFIQTQHCHGDIPLWPLKALCDYLEATSDFTILDAPVAWTLPGSATTTAETSTLFEHMAANLAWLRANCVPGTALQRYGDGDWNDSLQPAKPEFRDRLVSSWTVALCYQVLRRLEELSRRSGREFPQLAGFAEAVSADFHRLLIVNGTICGFFLFDEHSASAGQPLLHPEDRLTGIHYSLLPMTRSMLGGLLTPTEMEHHLGLINAHLLAADGARLMDRPPAYRGGVSEIFQRAELASCFSREIGIFYTHAHLRYIEAMARLGHADAMLAGFGQANPVDLKKSVPHALPRQANAYFSSSDAAVATRYEAAERYDEIKAGKVAVDGGWRIYSSGPGIFLNLVITRMLGLRTQYNQLILDPVLPRSLDGLTATVPWENHTLTVSFNVKGGTHTPRAISLNGTALHASGFSENPYRTGGWLLDVASFRQLLVAGTNTLEIHL
jgi:cellobiose phosphorylase